MTTSEDYTEEQETGGDDSQDNYFIYLSHFELLEWPTRRAYSPLLLLFHYFMM